MAKMTYSVPGEVDEGALRKQAAARREALEVGGCSTFTVGYRQGKMSIMCLCCGLGSMNPNDLLNRYCGFCSAYHTSWSKEMVEELDAE